MIEMELPIPWPAELVDAIPAQRKHTQRLLAEGTVRSYSVSADRSKVWMVVVVENANAAVDELLADFPMRPYIDYRSEMLMFTNDASSVMHYSLN